MLNCWSLGQDIAEKEAEKKYGSEFFDRLSQDMKGEFDNCTGFSTRNLRYIARFYRLYSGYVNLPHAVANSSETSDEANLPQVVANFETTDLFSVPWGHHRLIMDRCKNDSAKAMFFVRKILQNNWSRAVLENFLDTDLYDRQGKAISNFSYSLPVPQSDLAQEMTKDPYNFDF